MDVLIDECGKRGIKVILDYHRIHMTTEAELGTWWDDTTPESVWIDNWVKLANRYKGNPTVIGVSTQQYCFSSRVCVGQQMGEAGQQIQGQPHHHWGEYYKLLYDCDSSLVTVHHGMQ